jgi:transcriptional antiterminator NusG
MSDQAESVNVDAPAENSLKPTGTKRWFVVHAYSGMEKSVAKTLQERVTRAGLQSQFGRILVPTEEVVEIKGGKKAITERRLYSGYVLVEMDMADEAWHLVKSTPKVTGFLGGTANKPSPLPQREVDEILARMQEGYEKPRPKVLFEVEGRPVHRFQRQRRRGELRQEPGARVGDHFRSLHPGGPGVWSGREGLGVL